MGKSGNHIISTERRGCLCSGLENPRTYTKSPSRKSPRKKKSRTWRAGGDALRDSVEPSSGPGSQNADNGSLTATKQPKILPGEIKSKKTRNGQNYPGGEGGSRVVSISKSLI